MTEKTKETYNPFDPASHSTGGGVWGGQDVRITSSRYGIHRFINKDGVDMTKDEPDTYHIVKGVIVGEERERTELYRVGQGRKAAADGETLIWENDGKPATIGANTDHGKFLAGLQAGGFNFGRFTESGVPRISALEGAVLRFKGEVQKKKDGTEVRDKKGYLKYLFVPEKVVNQETQASTGNSTSADLTLAAKEAVYAVLTNKGNGKGLPRPILARELMAALQGKANAMQIISLATDEKFLRADETPWKYENNTVSLL